MVQQNSGKLGFKFGAHELRTTTANNTLENQADIATMRIYYHRKTRPEDNPTFKVMY